MTWGHKYGNRKPVAEYPLSNGYEGMQERLKTSYLEMAYDNGAWCAPVGMAWRAVRSERPDCILYRPDCYHPAGSGQLSWLPTSFSRRSSSVPTRRLSPRSFRPSRPNISSVRPSEPCSTTSCC